MTYGMTPEEFWHGPPELARAYREKAEIERDYQNQLAWWQGLYIYDALSVIKAQALSKDQREAEKYNYPQEPYRIKPYTEEELRQKQEEEAKKAREHAIAQFNLMKSSWDKKHGGNH